MIPVSPSSRKQKSPPAGSAPAPESSCHQLIGMMPDRMCLLDPGGRILMCNPAFAEAFDLPPAGLAGCSYFDLCPEAIAQTRRSHFETVMKTVRPEIFTDHLNGIWLEHRFFPFRNVKGGISGIAVISRDMTRFFLAAENANNQAADLNFLLNHLPGMVYRCSNDPGWPMYFASDGAWELTGYPSASFTFQNPFFYSELIHPEDRDHVWRGVQESVARGQSFTMEYRIITAGKEVKWVWERGRALAGDEGDRCWLEGMILDITAKKNLEEMAARQARQERELILARKNESLRRMAGGIAHHFNNKLQSVIGWLEMAVQECRQDSPAMQNLRKAMDTALQGAEEAASMGRNLLIYLGQIRERQERMDLRKEISAFVRNCGLTESVELTLTPEPVWIDGNREEIELILRQLLQNAVEARPAAMVRIELETEPSPSSGTASMALLRILDQGPGIPAAIRDQIFDPFFTTKFPGRGLGLSLVQSVLKPMKGRIEIRDAPRGGTCVTVAVPLLPSDSADSPPQEHGV